MPTSLLAFFAAISLLAPSLGNAEPPRTLDLKTLEGKNLSSGQEGEIARIMLNAPSRATVLVFLSAKCPCSAGHEDALKSLAETFTPQGFAFAAIHSNRDESETEAREYFKGRLPFPVLRDGDSPSRAPWAEALGALKTPHAFILNPQGQVIYAGGVDDSKDSARAKQHYLREALQAITEGRAPPRRETRTLGCAIRRSL